MCINYSINEMYILVTTILANTSSSTDNYTKWSDPASANYQLATVTEPSGKNVT